MAFLNPTLLLAGLACVAIPIAIHILMRRRRKPVPWAAMRFLLEAYRQQRKRTRLEQLLLLATRCLLVAVLAVALGRPAIQGTGLFASAGPRTLILVLDNSMTSGLAAEGKSTELDGLKARAEALLGELSSARGDAAALLTTGTPAGTVVSPPSTDLAGVLDALRRVRATESVSDLPAALGEARQLATGSGSTIAVLSAWRSGTADTSKPMPTLDLPESTRVVVSPPAERAAMNITVVDATPVRSLLIAPEGDQTPAAAQVRVDLRRSGELGAGATTVEVRAVGLNGTLSPPAVATMNWTPGQSAGAVAVNLSVPAELVRQGPALALAARVAEGTDGLTADDAVLRPIVSRRQVRVVILAARGQGTSDRPDLFTSAEWLSLALAPTQTALDRRTAEIEVSTVDPASSAAASDVLAADAVFVAAPDRLDEALLQSLRRMLDAGRLIVLMPAAGTEVATWSDRVTGALGVPWTIAKEPRTIEPAAAVAVPQAADKGLFALLSPELPDLVKPVRVSRVLGVEAVAERSRTLLSLEDGTPLLLAAFPPADSSRGMAVFLTAAPELSWTNLPAMPLMVPVVQEILRQGLGETSGATRAIAGRAMTVPREAAQFRWVEVGQAAGKREAAEVAPPAPAAHAGLFRTVDAAGRTLGLLAVNPDPEAGKVDTVAGPELERWLQPLSPRGRVSWMESGKADVGAAPAGSSVTAQDETSTPLDFWLLLAALGLGVVELVLARRFSNATEGSRSPGLSSTLPTAMPAVGSEGGSSA